MTSSRDLEESLREAAALGNEDGVEALVRRGVEVNAQNCINGWTALHWACKRGHRAIVERLLQHGADKHLLTVNGETCVQLTDNVTIMGLLGETGEPKSKTNSLPIVPNYISNPAFPYHDSKTPLNYSNDSSGAPATTSYNLAGNEVVLKVRVANSDERDFIEIDVPTTATFQQLVELMRAELSVAPSAAVAKVRKLPDTIVRNDRDVQRLRNNQELELVLGVGGSSTAAVAPAAASNVSPAAVYKSAVTPKRIDVVY